MTTFAAVIQAAATSQFNFEGFANGTWINLPTQITTSGAAWLVSPTTAGATPLSVSGILSGCTQLRVRCVTAQFSNVVLQLSQTGLPTYQLISASVVQGAAANLLCTNTPLVPTAATNFNSAATTNATVVKASAGRITALVATNNGAAVCFLKLYNKASAPTVGTDVPTLVISITANGVETDLACGALGLQFSTGIAFATTNLIADADTTAIAANQVKMMMSYV